VEARFGGLVRRELPEPGYFYERNPPNETTLPWLRCNRGGSQRPAVSPPFYGNRRLETWHDHGRVHGLWHQPLARLGLDGSQHPATSPDPPSLGMELTLALSHFSNLKSQATMPPVKSITPVGKSFYATLVAAQVGDVFWVESDKPITGYSRTGRVIQQEGYFAVNRNTGKTILMLRVTVIEVRTQ
jgi:hypothetical protein